MNLNSVKNVFTAVIAAALFTALLVLVVAAIGSVAWLEWWHPLSAPFGRGATAACFLYLTIVAVDL